MEMKLNEQVIQVNNNDKSLSPKILNTEWDLDDIEFNEEDFPIINDMLNEDGSLASVTFNKECDQEDKLISNRYDSFPNIMEMELNEQVIQVNNNDASLSYGILNTEWNLDDIEFILDN
ncbi:hypothetical protein L195_g038288 [Trifolium pratense]|uniref:Uncharacterized protein n=1 Tax=Trifolium pratense TaxID=57577 RepID=A0A2K3LUT0_TRIPR|nr:hypothetical protein L195_g038288 [Trifolium pratense]